MLEAIVLGLVQGLTEFLPVSSSGHLQGVPYLFGWEQPTIAFSVALHAGTLVAVVVYFWSDLVGLATAMLGIGDEQAVRHGRRTVLLLALASVPAAVVGLFIEEAVGDALGDPRLVAAFLVVTGVLLLAAERMRRARAAVAAGPEASASELRADHGRGAETVDLGDALAMGGAQALAIFPGISRAGATMATGMVRGLSRGGAARFSFLMSVPVIFGASVLEVGELTAAGGRYSGAEILVGTLAAGVSGYWAIRFLLRLVSTEDLTGFARYVFVAAAVLFGVALLRG